jgi:formylglycine-generating enzyme required for sulfatase activity
VVATVRADFYDPLIGNPQIRALLQTRQVLLAAMSRSELESTIVEPAKNVGLTFDPPGLVPSILDEAGDEGMLPLLQYALKESWALRKDNTITADAYARSGGVREAIRVTAERAFAALSTADQQAARQLFLRLVTPGEGQEDTRARAAMPTEPAQRRIVEQFAGPRTRLLVTGSDRAARPIVEVSHEALIRTWPRLRSWVDANREKLRARAAVLQAKAEWEHQEHRDDLLLPAGFQLERARALLADPGDLAVADIKDYIALSSAREERQRKEREEVLARTETAQARTARLVAALILAGLIALTYAGFSNQIRLQLWTDLYLRRTVLSAGQEQALKSLDSFQECASCPQMVVVPPGTFKMGALASEADAVDHDGYVRAVAEHPDAYSDEGPVHPVNISYSLAISKYDVTFDEWDACNALGGCTKSPSDYTWGRGLRPVIDVSWDDAKQYATWLSRITGKGYRLLTESEWEYAARAGTVSPYYWGDRVGRDLADCDGCGSPLDNRKTTTVGRFMPNAFGLRDMAGNAWQWVEDCYQPNYDKASSDGSATVSGSCEYHVLRGGSWYSDPRNLRSAMRAAGPQPPNPLANARADMIGFRVARMLSSDHVPATPGPH